MNRIFRRGQGNLVPDGTRVYPFLNPTDSTNDLPVGLFEGVSIALGEIEPGQSSRIQPTSSSGSSAETCASR